MILLRTWSPSTWRRSVRIPRPIAHETIPIFIKPLGVFRRAQDKNLHRRSLQQTGRKNERRRLKSVRSQAKRGHAAPSWFWLKIGALIIAILSAVVYMVPGGMRGSAPRTSAHVGDAGPPFIGTATLKVPPAWSIERADHYSLRSWVSDLILWSSATDLEPQRLGSHRCVAG